jgi:DNA-binding NtrC family response regulator
VERIGSEKPIKVDVRVIAATHHNLEDQVRSGLFRQDLFHRIFVFPVVLPPLRERREDIAPLIAHFAAQIANHNDWKPVEFTDEAVDALAKMPWPGNVRELRNAIERLMLLAANHAVSADMIVVAFPAQMPKAASAMATTGTLSEQVQQHERAVILAAIERNHHHISNTARDLGLERSHLYKKCQQLGIDLKRVARE